MIRTAIFFTLLMVLSIAGSIALMLAAVGLL